MSETKSRASAVMLLPLAVINCLKWWWEVQGQASHLLNRRTKRMSSLLPQQYLPALFKACRPAKKKKKKKKHWLEILGFPPEA